MSATLSMIDSSSIQTFIMLVFNFRNVATLLRSVTFYQFKEIFFLLYFLLEHLAIFLVTFQECILGFLVKMAWFIDQVLILVHELIMQCLYD